VRCATRFILIGSCWLAGCGAPSPQPIASAEPETKLAPEPSADAHDAAGDAAPSTADQGLFVDPTSFDFSRNPELVGRIAETPHRYFRFINIAFSRVVCSQYADAMKSMPKVSLHGDAHLEQYVVTDLGRGLTDFDDSSRGPAIMDLTRFGVSIYIAARQNGWQAQARGFLAEFLRGYEAGLKQPDLVSPAPALAERFKSGFTKERAGFLKYAESVMRPIDSDPAVQKKEFDATVGQYVAYMHQHRGDLPATFFDLKRAGVLKVGIGSALDRKFLLRVQGPTGAVDDDVILELKEVRTLSDIPCVEKRHADNGSAMIPDKPSGAYQPEYHLGSVTLPSHAYWVHEWSANYKELKVHKSLKLSEELSEVVFDVGVQLGRVHATKDGDAPVASVERQVEALRNVRDQLPQACEKMANETFSAWKAFKESAKTSGLLSVVRHASKD